MDITPEILANPQAAGFQTMMFTGSVTQQSAIALLQQIVKAVQQGKKGVWVGIYSTGGHPGAARTVSEVLASFPIPAISHAIEVFSEGACLALSFPTRTVAPTGKIGFHQASMTLNAGGYSEAAISDLLQQIKGHNRSMIEHVARSTGVNSEAVQHWIYDGVVFVGSEAVAAGVVRDAITPHHPTPSEHWMLTYPQ
jgi:Protease subunit of ATP-dependent Clp proteases